MADPMESGGASQRAAAMAAFSTKAKEQEQEKDDFKPHSQLSAREKAMANLNRKGVVSAWEARGATGASQHGAALANLGIKDEPAKVIPNWKRTDAQKNASAARAEILGSSTHSEAMAKFGGGSARGRTASVPGAAPLGTTSFVPVAKTPGGAPSLGGKATPRGALNKAAAPAEAPPNMAPSVGRPHAASAASACVMGANTAEAAEGVEKDLALLIAAFPRLGTANPDGSISTTFGKVIDDDELEQQLESLVGTLKAGRKRGVLEWEGQMLLKGPHDAVPIKYVGGAKPAAAEAAIEPAVVEPAAVEEPTPPPPEPAAEPTAMASPPAAEPEVVVPAPAQSDGTDDFVEVS